MNMKHLILEIIKDVIFTFIYYFLVVYLGCKGFADNPFDLKLFIAIFISFSSICIGFDVIDYLHDKRGGGNPKDKDDADSESDTSRNEVHDD